MITLPYSDSGLIIRTDFSKTSKWEIICNEINDPANMFETYALFVNDIKFKSLDVTQLPKFDYPDSIHTFVLLVDNFTSAHPDHPLNCINLYENFGSSFRVIPSEVWGITANLSLSNMDFEEFTYYLDKEGIFRGF